ncbi:uncharacterized protein LY89DRAFT_726588 [Mollisia scopiformis]|uniref:CBM1 domain-containing protein n=1 Tax=Mollisia scopiformis TaxID=149040 RepID=A0A132B3A7_MOLSC|nr:uncharacterized protein LY89DRAFT_726588 [Mollisia scopiformis]KUJ06404.1 hypothetical protein LY89DRAFT_726588 [Mollisia scopiformis]
MFFSKLAIAAVLALTNSVAAQVIVTVTNTITVVTVTVTPLSTSTKTTFVTVSAPPPTQQPTITSTSVVVVTVGPPATTAVTTCPIPLYYQCGGQGWNGCTYCTAGASCVSSNPYYFQCQNSSGPKVVTITSTIYRG